MYLALKAKEVGDEVHTKICLFDLNGKMYFDPVFLEVGPEKYEGLEFCKITACIVIIKIFFRYVFKDLSIPLFAQHVYIAYHTIM